MNDRNFASGNKVALKTVSEKLKKLKTYGKITRNNHRRTEWDKHLLGKASGTGILTNWWSYMHRRAVLNITHVSRWSH
jgi:hypothetical protein